MNICSLHGPEMVYGSESCPACRDIKEFKLTIVILEEELADYARTVTRLNKEARGRIEYEQTRKEQS